MMPESVPLELVIKYLEDNDLTLYADMIPATLGIVSVAEAFRVANRESWCEAFNLAVHRLTGAECVERADGSRRWYKDGELHRDDGPAIEYASGSQFWYQNGKMHREDGPAMTLASGVKQWLQHGNLHRIDGPAIEYPNGDQSWYRDGLRHRDDGPAVDDTTCGYRSWYQNGVCLRTEWMFS